MSESVEQKMFFSIVLKDETIRQDYVVTEGSLKEGVRLKSVSGYFCFFSFELYSILSVLFRQFVLIRDIFIDVSVCFSITIADPVK